MSQNMLKNDFQGHFKLQISDGRCTPTADRRLVGLFLCDVNFTFRAQCIAEVIRPALEAGRIVLCDRYTDSTEAYQGGGRQLGSQIVLQMHEQLCGGLNPDLTILIVPDFHRSISRTRRRNSADSGKGEGRFENEADFFHWRVYEKYVDIAMRDSARVVSIPGDLSIEGIHELIVQIVDNRLTYHRSHFEGSDRRASN